MHGMGVISLDLSNLKVEHLIQFSHLGLFAIRKERWASSQGKSHQFKQFTETYGGGLPEVGELSKSFLMSSIQVQACKP